ncbi:MAG TPA: M20/M25/M40 family metallo-hydrolase, partial [Thermoleophilaceae bacterium]|nr:M20/M25/M40 family metallo-hydrolase [Thermoleophilaceae bacterium]
DELCGLEVTVPGRADGGPRLCLNGHLDVVAPGTERWEHGPWSGLVAEGQVHGRGSVDMKGGVVAALHAMADRGPAAGCQVVLWAVASEEDGGQGTFAALEADRAFDACLIPEPTGLEVVCAQAGSLTFEGVVGGRAAHAGMRLEGESAIDNYVQVHMALAAHERDINAGVEYDLMAALELPYPVSVGRVSGGEWASSVPDRVEFTGRLGVPVGQDLDEARAALRRALAGLPVQVSFTGGVFAPGATDPRHPFAALVLESFPGSSAVGVPWGADMRQYTALGIPAVMVGPGNAHLAHAVDERVPIDDLAALAEGIGRVIDGFGGPAHTLSP